MTQPHTAINERRKHMALFSEDDKYFDLAKEVFIEFARFEYCLKVTGYLVTRDGDAKPNWDEFSNCSEMKELFDEIKSEDAKTCGAMRYILDNPPKQQIAKDGNLDWLKKQSASCSQEYFGAVRRVRNNLFHGGKFNGHFLDPERSAKLLEGVLCVLKCARDRHAEIEDAYKG